VVGRKLELWPTDAQEVALLRERVDEAGRVAVNELKELKDQGKGGGRKRRWEEGGGRDEKDRDDDTVEAGMPKRRKKSNIRR